MLTPCVLPILPIVLGSSVIDGGTTSRKRAYMVIGSLIVSVFIFTFLLKVSTALIMVPPEVWTYLSGIIIFVFGLSLVRPDIWSKLTAKIFSGSNNLLNQSFQNRNKWWGDIALGASLGPIFTTCSPTFFVILATVLPVSVSKGVIYLLAYSIGLALALFAIAFLGQKILLKFSNLSDPNSGFKKILGYIFIVLAILVASGLIKKIETKILDAGFFDFTKIEITISRFLGGDGMGDTLESAPTQTQVDANKDTPINKKNINKKPVDDYATFKYKEIVSPSGFVNGKAFKLADLVGKKVILLDFMTYSCINCQRTYPYLNAWYKMYKDQGLEIVGIHTPEFAFEKDIDNVREAALEFGLQFPIVLDNDYATWNAYGNRYWPRKYLIDIEGNVVYDHIGEGSYDKTEAKIKELLMGRAEKMGTYVSEDLVEVEQYKVFAYSPETYFGAWRNTNFGNGTPSKEYQDKFIIPEEPKRDTFYFGGEWKINEEFSENIGSPVELVFKFDAKEVYMVAESYQPVGIQVYLDGSLIVDTFAGKDVKSGKAIINDSRLYHLLSLPVNGEHTLRIIFDNPGAHIYTFTFG